ncbi:MAG: hypothetical protein EAX96_07595 [Candidatus Lokiarchaeota archaeon]|nr:hypothetical protein [Candidatus Lokiarchaeota archaeon]
MAQNSAIVNQIFALIEEANKAINEAKFETVYQKYIKIAELCNQIGDKQNAASYQEAAKNFRIKAIESKKREKQLKDAINRAVNAAKIAYQNKEFGKISDLYYNVASMLHELGDEQNATKFSNSAKKFRERSVLEQKGKDMVKQLPKEIQSSIKQSPITSNDLVTSEARPKSAESPPAVQVSSSQQKIPQPTSAVPRHLAPSALSNMRVNINKLDKFMESLGLKCPKCGTFIKDIQTKICPNCSLDLTS